MHKEKLVAHTNTHRINHQIRSPYVRLISQEGEVKGIVSLYEALRLAQEEGLDLVEMGGRTSENPTCRIMDYGKMQYAKKKAEKKSTSVSMKIVKLRYAIGPNDLATKISHIKEMLEHGDHVKVMVQFRGREIAHKSLGVELLQKISAALWVAPSITMEGKSMFIIFTQAHTGAL
jgi:translation initiation factor IF-3